MSLVKQILLSLILVGAGLGSWHAYRNPEILGAAGEVSSGGAQEPQARGARGGRPAGAPGGRGGGVANVVTATVAMERIDEAVAALGTAKAVRSVTVFPQVTGIVEEIAFTPGSRVEAGALLLRLEDDVQTIAVERARLALEQAGEALERARQLAKSRTTSAVAVADAERAVELAEIELRSAEIERARHEIRAPFAGVTGLTDISEGDLVTSSTEIVSLDDLSTILVRFEVPERWAGRIAAGKPITATARALPGAQFTGTVTAVDNRIDEASRTVRMDAALANEGEGLKPGMSLAVGLAFEGADSLAVPSLALQWDRDGSFVWKLDSDVVQRAEATILRRRRGAVIVAGDLQAGDRVVVEGVQRLRPGAQVTPVADLSAPVEDVTTGDAAPSDREPPTGESARPPAVPETPTPEPRPETGAAAGNRSVIGGRAQPEPRS
jgi:RND family efflux transporter MFP subunit